MGVECKAWTVDGEYPDEKVAGENSYIGVGGLHWYPKAHIVSLPIGGLHFGTVKRWGFSPNVAIFKGSFQDLENFVPRNLSLRQVVSKVATISDIRGMPAPLIGSLRLDSRKTCRLVMGWDDPMPDSMRNKWIQNFLGIKTL